MSEIHSISTNVYNVNRSDAWRLRSWTKSPLRCTNSSSQAKDNCSVSEDVSIRPALVLTVRLTMRFARFSFFALSLLPLAASQTECLPNDNAVLRAAITDYIESGGNLNPNSDAAMRYGFPIGTWCVDNVEDFSFAFQGFTEFDESLENWNTESAVDMSFMFVNAEAYNQPMANWDVR